MEIVRDHMRTERLKTFPACRFCLAQDVRLSSIFAAQDQNRVAAPLPMQIMSCVGIEVYREDGMPGMICDNCRVLMSYCYQFKQMCNAADTQLKTFLSTGIWPKKLEIANELQALLQNLKQPPAQTKKSPSATPVQSKKPEPSDTEPEKKVNIIKLSPADLKNFKQTQKVALPNPKQLLTEPNNVSSSLPLMTSTPITKRAPTAQIRAGIEVLKANGQKQSQPQKQTTDKPPIILNNLVNSAAPKVAEEFISTGDGTVEMVLAYETLEFLSQEELNKHLENHEKNRPFKCSYCPKRFAYKQGMERHELVHQDKLPFQCEYCEESFLTSGKLLRHLTKHAGERPYPCRLCNKSFLLSHHLSRHLRSHNGTTAQHQYQCNECGAIFDQMEGYVRHSQEHAKHNGQCPLCHEHVGDAHSIAEHMKTHKTDWYPCDYCDLMFTSERKLDDHCQGVHRNELAYERPDGVQEAEEEEDPEGADEEKEEDEGHSERKTASDGLEGLVVNYGELQEEELIDDGLFLEDESTLVPDPLHEGDTFEITEIEVRAASPIETKPTVAASPAPVAKAASATKVSPPSKGPTGKAVPQAVGAQKTPRQQRMQEFYKRNQLAAEKKIAHQQQSVSDMLKQLPKGVTIKPRTSTAPPQIKVEPEEKKPTESVPIPAPKASVPTSNVPVKKGPGRPPKVLKPVEPKEPASSSVQKTKKEDPKPTPKAPTQPTAKKPMAVVEKPPPVERKELKRSASALIISKPRTITAMPEEQENAATSAGTKPTKPALQPPATSWMIKRSYAPKEPASNAAQGKKRPAEPDVDQPAPSKRPALSRKTLNPSMLRQTATAGKQTESSRTTGANGGSGATVAAAAALNQLKRIPKSIGTPMEMNVGGRTIKVQKISKEQAIALSSQIKGKTVG
uniref:Protein krueppel n=1 Tax=Anopheles dirus TaxID=7168 RepID=A0A182NIP9_9DIPT